MNKFQKLVCVDETGIEEFVADDLQMYANEIEIYHDYPKNESEIVNRIKDADAVLVSWNTRITADILQQCKHLKYIGMCCSLYLEESANVDIRKAREQNIKVCGVRDYGDDGVVEYLISELIQYAQGLRNVKTVQEPIELKTLSLGIVGLGAVGEKMAEAASFFGMRVCYHNRTKKPDSPYTYMSLEELLTSCDVVSLHLPRNTVVMKEKQFEKLGNHKVLMSSGIGYAFEKKAFDAWIADSTNYAIMDIGSVDSDFVMCYTNAVNVNVNKKVSGFTYNARKRLSEKVMQNIKKYLEEA